MTTPSTTPSTTPPTNRRLIRTDDRWLGGVCGGVARYLDVDVTLIRIATLVGVVLGFGTVIVGYIAAWVLMPDESTAREAEARRERDLASTPVSG